MRISARKSTRFRFVLINPIIFICRKVHAISLRQSICYSHLIYITNFAFCFFMPFSSFPRFSHWDLIFRCSDIRFSLEINDFKYDQERKLPIQNCFSNTYYSHIIITNVTNIISPERQWPSTRLPPRNTRNVRKCTLQLYCCTTVELILAFKNFCLCFIPDYPGFLKMFCLPIYF